MAQESTRLGTYEIEAPAEPAATGGVYRALDRRLDRPVVLHVLDPDGAPPRAALEREARLLSRLRHPRIAALYDLGESEGAFYLVREHVEGRTLGARLLEGPLPVAEALRHGAEIAEALHGGHRQGFAHGSLTPARVMVTQGGVKLLDYGLARLTRREPDGADSDIRKDVAALGAILLEMLAGPSRVLDPALEGVTRRCLAEDPDERWPDAGAVAAELRRILEHEPPRRDSPAPVASPARRFWLVAALVGATAAAALLYVVGLR